MTRCRPCATSSMAIVCEESASITWFVATRKNDWIDLVAICDDRLRRLESVLQQSRDQGMPIQSAVAWPILPDRDRDTSRTWRRRRSQGPSHRLYFPSGLAGDGLRDAGQIGPYVYVVLIAEIFDLEPEFPVHLCLQR